MLRDVKKVEIYSNNPITGEHFKVGVVFVRERMRKYLSFKNKQVLAEYLMFSIHFYGAESHKKGQYLNNYRGHIH